MLSIINICPIVKDHYVTLKEDANMFVLLVIFLVLPLLSAIALVYYDLSITENILNAFITSFAIFIGFIINLLILLLTKQKEQVTIRNTLTKHLSFNSLYALLLGLLILFISIIGAIIFAKINSFVIIIISLLIYALVFHFLLTILMISKRFYALFKNKLKELE